MRIIPIKATDERLPHLTGARKSWWDTKGGRKVSSQTLYMPFGCPDWGETDGKRNELCQFCGLPGAVIQFREAFNGGKPIGDDLSLNLFDQTLKQAVSRGPFHTLMVFNAGSFAAMPESVQYGVAEIVSKYDSIERLVIESRATVLQDRVLSKLAAMLRLAKKEITVRIGVETKDDEFRLKVLRKGHSAKALKLASAMLRDHGIASGAYVLLKPAPGMDEVAAVRECVETVNWVFDKHGLHMDEVYLGPTCVSPNTPLEYAWKEGRFNPPTLSSVQQVLKAILPKYEGRVHLLPFRDEPSFLAVPSDSNPRGLPESIKGATGEEIVIHSRFDLYRETMRSSVLFAER